MRARLEYDDDFSIFVKFDEKPSLKTYDQNYEWLPFEIFFYSTRERDNFFNLTPNSFVLHRLIDGDTMTLESWQIYKIFDLEKKEDSIVMRFEGCSLLN